MKKILATFDHMLRGTPIEYYGAWLSYWTLGFAFVIGHDASVFGLSGYAAFRDLISSPLIWSAILATVGIFGLYAYDIRKLQPVLFFTFGSVFTFAALGFWLALDVFGWASFTCVTYGLLGYWNFIRLAYGES